MLTRRPASFVSVALAILIAGCSRARPEFSEPNARAHVDLLAGSIGSRPLGSPAAQRARQYLVGELSAYGFEVRVQEVDAQRPEFGLTSRVANIIAVLPGKRTDAIGLVAHYDSAPNSPGAADDAFGVAVCLETARLQSLRRDRNYSLMVLLTDGEEIGLMGAAALIEDLAVVGRLTAYLNFEAIGSAGPSYLFEQGPDNFWLLDAWRDHAPNPRGSSIAGEIYRRLPNDTDFSVLQRRRIPGLNFALIGDSYAYHTARDTTDRLDPSALRATGENALAIVAALDRMEPRRGASDEATYFDIAGIRGLRYGSAARTTIALLAVLLSAVAWVRGMISVVRTDGIRRFLLTILWGIVLTVIVGAVGLGAAWLLRAAREVYHPWYAHPWALFCWILATTGSVVWLLGLLVRSLPGWATGIGQPLSVWLLTLPVWTGLAIVAELRSPAASHLWTVPLLVAGAILAPLPLGRTPNVRIASVVILGVVGTMWIPVGRDFYLFMVPVFGRMATVAPFFVLPAALIGAGLMVVPPIVALGLARDWAPLCRRSTTAIVLLGTLLLAAGIAYFVPAYTEARPLRRHVRFIHDAHTGRALWEVGGNEAALDVQEWAEGFGWHQVADRPDVGAPIDRLPHPFVFRAAATGVGQPPGMITRSLLERGEEIDLEVTVLPGRPSITAAISLPPGMTPLRSNYPGRVSGDGRWSATFAGIPPEGITFRVTVPGASGSSLRDGTVLLTSSELPGGVGWQGLPAWLPQDRTVWTSVAIYAVPIGGSLPADARALPTLAPPGALR